MKAPTKKFTFLLLGLLLSFAGAWAQQTGGSISGTVADQTGAIIPKVAVTATNAATGVTNTVRTNTAGAYSFLSLPIGTYTLHVHLSGFKDYRQTNVTLNVNDALRKDIELEVGMASQTVEVSANAAHVDTNSATIGQVVGGRSIVDQPLVNRSYIDLMGLQAGVNPSTGAEAGNVSVSGGRTDANGFSVNGGNVEESGHNGTAIIPNADAIAEFEIVTNSATAEYGHYSGGAISVITKSGTNNFHGDLFEFWRNQNFDAITPFANEKGPYNHNQFGGTFGGPIKKKRLFFFGDYQGTRNTTGNIDIVTVPTNGTVPAAPGVPVSNELAGNLSDRTGTASPYNDFYGSVSSANFASVLQSRLSYAVSQAEPYYYDSTQIDPQTITPSNPGGSPYPGPCTTSAYSVTPGVNQTGCVFPNAIIPTAAWSPPAFQLLKYVPTPTPNAISAGLPAFESSTAASTLRDDKGSARIDATSGWGQLSFYYFLDNSSFFGPYGQGDLPGFAAPGIPRTIVPTRYNNFAPRFAFAYSPNYTKGLLAKMFGPSGHTAINGAWGIFYDIVDDSTLLDQVADAPFILYWQQNNTLFATPWELMNGTDQGQHFPFTPPTPGDKNIDWSYFEPITSSPGVAITDHLPYTEEYNFTIQRQVGPNSTVSVAYVGSQAHRLPGSVEANPGIPSICAFLSNPANLAPGSDTCGPGNENDLLQLSAANGGGTVYGTRQPLGINFGAGDQYLTTAGRSTYNSLQATVNHTGKSYTLMVAYTWSKSMDTGSENGAVFDPLPDPLPTLPNPLPNTLFQRQPSTVLFGGAPNYDYFRALSDFDVPQNLVVSYSYTLPFEKLIGHPSRFTDGWTVTGTTRFASGTPIGLRYGIDNSYIGTFNLDVPDFNGGSVSHLNPSDLAANPDRFWINCPKVSSTCATGLFSPEPLGQIGDAMRYSIIGPGINNTDVSLSKSLAITKERRLQLRIDAFNVFNHTQFANPSGNYTSANFMRITRARPARITQAGIKFLF